jgi:hypothetical protein
LQPQSNTHQQSSRTGHNIFDIKAQNAKNYKEGYDVNNVLEKIIERVFFSNVEFFDL